jgi:hypothetical protein
MRSTIAILERVEVAPGEGSEKERMETVEGDANSKCLVQLITTPTNNGCQLRTFCILPTVWTGALRNQGSVSVHATHFLIFQAVYLIRKKCILICKLNYITMEQFCLSQYRGG